MEEWEEGGGEKGCREGRRKEKKRKKRDGEYEEEEGERRGIRVGDARDEGREVGERERVRMGDVRRRRRTEKREGRVGEEKRSTGTLPACRSDVKNEVCSPTDTVEPSCSEDTASHAHGICLSTVHRELCPFG